MRTRLLLILIIALIVSLTLAGSPRATQLRTASPLRCLWPPAGLELPMGQAIEIRCRLVAPAVMSEVEFRLDEHSLHTQTVVPGRAVAVTWIPGQIGRQTLTAVARSAGRQMAIETRHVLVVPRGAPVRVP
jgi:hypothetical protein